MVFFSSTQKTPQFFRPTYHWQNAGIFGLFVPGEAKSQGFLQGSSDFHIRGQPERLPAAGFSWWAHQDFLPSTAVRPSGASAEKYAPFVGALRLRIGEVSGRRVPRDFPPFAEHPDFQSISKKRDTELDGAVRRRSRFVQRVPHRRPRCSKMPTRLPAKGLQRSVAEYKASAKKKTKELRSQVTGARGLAGG